MRVLIGTVILLGGFGLFFWAIFQGATAPGCTGASNAPCGAGLPAVLGVLALILGLLVLTVGGMIAGRLATQDIRQRGSDARATVLAIGETGTTVNDDPLVRLQLRVEPADGSTAYEAEVKTLISRLSIPRPGDQVAVRYLKDEPSKVALAEGAPFITAPPSGAAATIDELTRLAALRDSGAITDAEFETLKQRLISR